MYTRAQLISFIQSRYAGLDGTAADETYYDQIRYVGMILSARAVYAINIQFEPSRVTDFNTKAATIPNTTDIFGDITDLITLAQNAVDEDLRTRYLKSAAARATTIANLVYDVIGGDDVW